MTQPKPGCCCFCQCVVTAQAKAVITNVVNWEGERAIHPKPVAVQYVSVWIDSSHRALSSEALRFSQLPRLAAVPLPGFQNDSQPAVPRSAHVLYQPVHSCPGRCNNPPQSFIARVHLSSVNVKRQLRTYLFAKL